MAYVSKKELERVKVAVLDAIIELPAATEKAVAVKVFYRFNTFYTDGFIKKTLNLMLLEGLIRKNESVYMVVL